MKIELQFIARETSAMDCVGELRLAVKASGWPPKWVMLAMLLCEMEILDDDDWPSEIADKLIDVIGETYGQMIQPKAVH